MATKVTTRPPWQQQLCCSDRHNDTTTTNNGATTTTNNGATTTTTTETTKVTAIRKAEKKNNNKQQNDTHKNNVIKNSTTTMRHLAWNWYQVPGTWVTCTWYTWPPRWHLLQTIRGFWDTYGPHVPHALPQHVPHNNTHQPGHYNGLLWQHKCHYMDQLAHRYDHHFPQWHHPGWLQCLPRNYPHQQATGTTIHCLLTHQRAPRQHQMQMTTITPRTAQHRLRSMSCSTPTHRTQISPTRQSYPANILPTYPSPPESHGPWPTSLPMTCSHNTQLPHLPTGKIQAHRHSHWQHQLADS